MNDAPAAWLKALFSPFTHGALERQVAGLRAELARVQQELAAAHIGLDGNRNAQLRDANEQLILSALRAQQAAETTACDLGELTRSSQRDALTATPNRALMRDRLEQAIVLARRHGGRCAVLFVDLDHFKAINDALGHGAGDEVLQLSARRLESVVRESDTVSRHGGDEFLVLLAEVLQEADGQIIAAKMLAALFEPCVVRAQTMRLTASIGIALYPDDAADAATLIGHADAAMYLAKRRSGDGFERHREAVADPAHGPGGQGLRKP